MHRSVGFAVQCTEMSLYCIVHMCNMLSTFQILDSNTRLQKYCSWSDNLWNTATYRCNVYPQIKMWIWSWKLHVLYDSLPLQCQKKKLSMPRSNTLLTVSWSYRLVYSLTHSFVASPTVLQFYSLFHSLIHCFKVSLTVSQIHSLFHSPTHCLIAIFQRAFLNFCVFHSHVFGCS